VTYRVFTSQVYVLKEVVGEHSWRTLDPTDGRREDCRSCWGLTSNGQPHVLEDLPMGRHRNEGDLSKLLLFNTVFRPANCSTPLGNICMNSCAFGKWLGWF
jgi:hypothetical protein